MDIIKRYIMQAALFFLFQNTLAQISVTTLNQVYTQNFNTLRSASGDADWVNNVTLPGWFAAYEDDGVYEYFDEYMASNGSLSSSDLYSFGITGNTDRALGFIGNDDAVYGVLFQNNSGQSIQSITLSFRAEHWRRVKTSSKGHQRVKVGYQHTSIVNTSEQQLLNGTFIELPEAFLLTNDTTTQQTLALDGNLPANAAQITVTFPVNWSTGQQLFLRFYDENASGTDMGIGLDDLQVTFSPNAVERIAGSSEYDFFAYFDQGILHDIPDEDEGKTYEIPDLDDRDEWGTILQEFYSGLFDDVECEAYSYEVTDFTSTSTGKTYHILRKKNTSGYYWGTYVVAGEPTNMSLALQAPHPINDTYSDRQGAAIFERTGAYAYMVAGIHRCVNATPSGCSGHTDACEPNGLFRISDVAHTETSIFHIATETLAGLAPALVFVQLHGFSQDAGEPEFIISCGTENAHDKSGPDYPVALREAIINAHPEWQVAVTHADHYEERGALTNVQGRFLNNFPLDICTSNAAPQTVTNRFLHIEQFKAVREYVIHYAAMADAIASVINDLPKVPYVDIDDTNAPYFEDFNSLSANAGQHTWGNDLHLPGWHAFMQTDGLFSFYQGGNGSDSGPGLYSFGATTDRALGTLNADASGHMGYGLLIRNNTGTNINTVTLSCRAEQWRRATNAAATPQRIRLSYAVGNNLNTAPSALLNNAAFTNLPAGDLVTIDNSQNTGAIDGNQLFHNVNITFPVSLAHHQQIFIRFYDDNAPGLDKAMALDDLLVSFSANESLSATGTGGNVRSTTQAPALFYKDGYFHTQGAQHDHLQQVLIYNAIEGSRHVVKTIAEGNGQYRIEYPVPTQQLLIVRLTFNSGVYAHRMVVTNK